MAKVTKGRQGVCHEGRVVGDGDPRSRGASSGEMGCLPSNWLEDMMMSFKPSWVGSEAELNYTAPTELVGPLGASDRVITTYHHSSHVP